MSMRTYVLHPAVTLDAVLTLAQRDSWTLVDERRATFSTFASRSWATPAGATVHLTDIHQLGLRLISGDGGELPGDVACIERETLLVWSTDERLERRAFGLRALAYLERDAPSSELRIALTRAASHDNRAFRQMIIFLCGLGTLSTALRPMIVRRAADDRALAEDWLGLLDQDTRSLFTTDAGPGADQPPAD